MELLVFVMLFYSSIAWSRRVLLHQFNARLTHPGKSPALSPSGIAAEARVARALLDDTIHHEVLLYQFTWNGENIWPSVGKHLMEVRLRSHELRRSMPRLVNGFHFFVVSGQTPHTDAFHLLHRQSRPNNTVVASRGFKTQVLTRVPHG